MTSQHRTAAVLLDLDGVVRFFPPEDEADACVAAGLPPGSVLETAFRPGNLDPAINGSVRDDEWRRAVAWDLEHRHQIPLEAALALVEAWSRSPGEVEPVALQAISTWRASGVRVVLLTNATTRLWEDLSRIGLDDAFDAVVSSAETGLAKPDPGAFRAALDVVGRLLGREPEPAEVLVVDDSATNVAAAQALGLRGYHAVTRGVLPVLP